MKQLATRMALSMKAKNEMMYVVDGLETLRKTKDMVVLINLLPTNGKTTLVLVGEGDALGLVVRNIPNVDLQRAIDVNVVDLMHHQHLVMTKGAVQTLESRLA